MMIVLTSSFSLATCVLIIALGVLLHGKLPNGVVRSGNSANLVSGFYRPVVMPGSIQHSCDIEGSKIKPFTQGLLFTSDSTVLESSGLSGSSFLREFDVDTGETLRHVKVDGNYFAEGATIVVEPSTLRRYVMLLTYTDNVILMYDYVTFELVHRYPLKYVGFGLTSNYDFRCNDLAKFVKHQKLWMTTGNSSLISMSIPVSFSTGAPVVESTVPITLSGKPLFYVNELEYRHVSDTIYGNVWPTNYIVEIDYRSGACLSVWDLSRLSKAQPSDVDVLNGIACHPSKDECIITGKIWPSLHYVTFSKRDRLAMVNEDGNY